MNTQLHIISHFLHFTCYVHFIKQYTESYIKTLSKRVPNKYKNVYKRTLSISTKLQSSDCGAVELGENHSCY